MIAALYVMPRGPYFDLDGVDPWDEARDARTYNGPYPVVAHPPCERWGRFYHGSPSQPFQHTKGDDGGCFAAAIGAVRRWGGVLEHPADSSAWLAFDLLPPPKSGGWIRADWMTGQDGWTCHIEQGQYGHRARKATWLYAHGVDLPSLRWGSPPGVFDCVGGMGFHSAEERAAFKDNPASVPWAQRKAEKVALKEVQFLSKRQRSATPPQFRDLLLSIARTATQALEASRDPS